MSAQQTKFDWSATESAPEGYAMRIINGNLRYHGDPIGAGLYVPNRVTIAHGWGQGRSSHVTGAALKPLPDRLDITFFSYLEDQFYQGSFDLPYDKILAIFSEEEAKPKKLNADGKGIPVHFKIIVGVAPGGTVAVWASANGNKEVFFGQAKKVEMDYAKNVFDVDNHEERVAYSKKVAERESTPEILAAIRKNGIPFNKWSNFRTRYNWMPTFVGNPPKSFGAIYYNGEGKDYELPLEKSFGNTSNPMPRKVDFKYIVPGDDGSRYFMIQFNEPEILDAFAKLSAKQLPLKLEFDPRFPISQTKIRLHNGKESIELKKFTVK